ncbi:(2Fe-2S)-binding protein [Massilia sp. MB5]|uniref:2Fe-2S iron-sulfur cluster-binding protein n=1 Tax=unclassified Massilia TaxID=2609279 RepID=UPI00067BF34B|nr:MULTISPECIES: 2Fe-2S iron-sulfur cluster-binding protein [unclassified Massilia]AKU21568.1 ferredoxin [Massilia sp. NR 4-1]UMR28837.1 (2Fe-2S)-binding protein [Massilia sp. MB5]
MSEHVHILIDGERLVIAAGSSVAAAVALANGGITRRSVSGMPRAPLCGMGVCHECRVSIDGHAHQLACQTLCTEGMRVRTGWAENEA